MVDLNLGYGTGAFSFQYDDSRFELLAPVESRSLPLTDVEINIAIDSPIGSNHLEDLVGSGDSVLIVVSDATRATASAQIVNLLVRRLIAAGVAPGEIGVIFATGIHRATTFDEKRRLLSPFILQRIRAFDHDASDETQLVSLGVTSHGTPIEVNRALKEYSHVFLTGGIGFHYFAGFTGGRKSVCPGLASTRTITATHMLALDFEQGGRRAGVGSGILDGNAVHEECVRIAAEVQPAFLVNSIVDEEGRAVGVFAGHWRDAHLKACEEYTRGHSALIEGKRDLVIASCGGAPYDINLIQAHKAMDMAAKACSEGGTIILIAACNDGLGRPDFLKWFTSPNAMALASRLKTAYEVNGQTAWSLLTKAEAFRVILVSELAPDVVRQMRMIPARSLAEAIAAAGESAGGFIMPRGASLLPIVKH